jgi:carboxypeptidase T
MRDNHHRRLPLALRLVVPAFLALLPLLAVGGGFSGSALAGVPTQGVTGSPAAAQPQSFVLRVYFSDNAERDRLAAELGADHGSTRDGYLTVVTDQAGYGSILARGLRVEIDQVATKEINSPVPFGHNQDPFWGGYYTVEEVFQFIDQKVAANPTLAEKIDIGDSWCKTHPGVCTQPAAYNGYDLYVMHITNRNIPGPKPVFWYNAGLHSREIASPELAIRYISYLLDNYNINADARWLVDYHDIWIIPLSNPDGHHIVEAGPSQPYLHRKNADRDDGCTTWPPSSSNHFGVDLNRNFPYKWNYCAGCSSGVPCNQTYRGPVENSEEETQALAAKIRQLIPDQRGPGDADAAPITTTGMYLDMHSVAAQNLYPYGWTSNPNQTAPNNNDLRNIAGHMTSQNAQPPGNGYEFCQAGPCLYPTDGASDDWEYGELGAPAYTIELGGSSFTPPYPEVETIWNDNRGTLLYMSKLARTPYLTNRGPDVSVISNMPITVTQGTPALLTGTLNYVWTAPDPPSTYNNFYLQNVAAAEYYVDTPPWAGGVGMPMSAVDGAFNSPTEASQATINTGSLPPGRHIVFVRGRGVNDYEGHQSWGPISAVFLDVQAGGGTQTPGATITAGATPSTTAIATSTIGTPPAATSTSMPTSILPTLTVVSTSTPVGGTGTPVSQTSTATPIQPTGTSVGATTTPTTCALQFADVPSTNTFYANVRCLACRGIISGYPCGGTGEPCNGNSDPYFRPNNDITRGQIAKVVSQSAGFSEPAGTRIYEDVPEASPFFTWIQRLSNRGLVGGYGCGNVPEEPCVAPDNRPYFRPNANATRGQLSKIVASTKGITTTPTGQTYEDVTPDNTFYTWIEQLSQLGVMGGYPCGSTGEPCGTGNKPYFRPANNVTRGQASKIVANTFFPGCQSSSKR